MTRFSRLLALFPFRTVWHRVGLMSLLLMLLVAPGPATAAAPPWSTAPDSSATPAPDRTPRVQLRRPAASRLQDFRRQRAFQYVEVKSEQNGWDRFWAGFWRWVASLLDTPSGAVAWRYGFYAFLVLALGFAILKFMQVDLTRAFGRAPRRTPLSYDAAPEDLHALDLAPQLAEAEAHRNYRLAVRLGYLLVLRQLSDKGLIRWQPEKTNHDYLYELPPGPLPEAFRELTRQFEYVWYGEQDDLSAADYERVRATREAFQRRLSSTSLAA